MMATLVLTDFLPSPIFLFYKPQKIPGNLWFSVVFRGYKIETLARNGLNAVTQSFALLESCQFYISFLQALAKFLK